MTTSLVDYCTFFPEGTWGGCCRLHDIAYADPLAGKLTADWHLMTCIAHDGGWPTAIIAFLGVFVGGLPFFIRARWRR